jgi:hypothetical protein
VHARARTAAGRRARGLTSELCLEVVLIAATAGVRERLAIARLWIEPVARHVARARADNPSAFAQRLCTCNPCLGTPILKHIRVCGQQTIKLLAEFEFDRHWYACGQSVFDEHVCGRPCVVRNGSPYVHSSVTKIHTLNNEASTYVVGNTNCNRFVTRNC